MKHTCVTAWPVLTVFVLLVMWVPYGITLSYFQITPFQICNLVLVTAGGRRKLLRKIIKAPHSAALRSESVTRRWWRSPWASSSFTALDWRRWANTDGDGRDQSQGRVAATFRNGDRDRDAEQNTSSTYEFRCILVGVCGGDGNYLRYLVDLCGTNVTCELAFWYLFSGSF